MTHEYLCTDCGNTWRSDGQDEICMLCGSTVSNCGTTAYWEKMERVINKLLSQDRKNNS